MLIRLMNPKNPKKLIINFQIIRLTLEVAIYQKKSIADVQGDLLSKDSVILHHK